MINTYVRCYHNNDVSIQRHMTTESSPSSFTSERESSQTSEWKHLTPSIDEQRGDIFIWVIVIDLIRARAICIQRVIRSESRNLKLLVNHLLNNLAFSRSREIRGKRFLRFKCCLNCNYFFAFSLKWCYLIRNYNILGFCQRA